MSGTTDAERERAGGTASEVVGWEGGGTSRSEPRVLLFEVLMVKSAKRFIVARALTFAGASRFDGDLKATIRVQ